MSLIDAVHGNYVFKRRIARIASHLCDQIPPEATIIDVGCGDGTLGRRIMTLRPDVRLRGVEVSLREETQIPVELYSGTELPFGPGDFDVVLLVDVLHHVLDPTVLLREAGRVAQSAVLIKDHLKEGFLADSTLRFMDRVGNARYGVPLPYKYWTRAEWNSAFRSSGLRMVHWREDLGLYPPPASWLFDRSLHFIALLKPDQASLPNDLEHEESVRD